MMGILMQKNKCNEVENAFPIFKVSRLVRVHTDSHRTTPSPILPPKSPILGQEVLKTHGNIK